MLWKMLQHGSIFLNKKLLKLILNIFFLKRIGLNVESSYEKLLQIVQPKIVFTIGAPKSFVGHRRVWKYW